MAEKLPDWNRIVGGQLLHAWRPNQLRTYCGMKGRQAQWSLQARIWMFDKCPNCQQRADAEMDRTIDGIAKSLVSNALEQPRNDDRRIPS